MSQKVCAVVGVGPGNGASIARRFARDGCKLALLARSEETTGPLAANLPGAKAYRCDVGDASSVVNMFDAIARDLGLIDVVVYNAGGGVWGDVTTIDLDGFE